MKVKVKVQEITRRPPNQARMPIGMSDGRKRLLTELKQLYDVRNQLNEQIARVQLELLEDLVLQPYPPPKNLWEA